MWSHHAVTHIWTKPPRYWHNNLGVSAYCPNFLLYWDHSRNAPPSYTRSSAGETVLEGPGSSAFPADAWNLPDGITASPPLCASPPWEWRTEALHLQSSFKTKRQNRETGISHLQSGKKVAFLPPSSPTSNLSVCWWQTLMCWNAAQKERGWANIISGR